MQEKGRQPKRPNPYFVWRRKAYRKLEELEKTVGASLFEDAIRCAVKDHYFAPIVTMLANRLVRFFRSLRFSDADFFSDADSGDLNQRTLRKILLTADGLYKKGRLRDRADLLNWIAGIAANVAIALRRQKLGHPVESIDEPRFNKDGEPFTWDPPAPSAEQTLPDSIADLLEKLIDRLPETDRKMVEKLFDRLPETDREILELRSEGHTYSAIGAKLHMTGNAVRQRTHRLRRKLLEKLIDRLPETERKIVELLSGGYSYPAIGAELHMTGNEVRERIHRLRRTLHNDKQKEPGKAA